MRAGDHDGLARLYDRHATAVYSLALRIVGRVEDAEDVTQQVFTQAWRSAARYDATRGAVGAWLIVMTRTRALDLLRARAGSTDRYTTDVSDDVIADPGPSVECILASRQQVERARSVVATLPDEQRVALELAYYDGLSQSEIAERTATPLGTVKSRVRSALTTLRTALASTGAVGGGQP